MKLWFGSLILADSATGILFRMVDDPYGPVQELLIAAWVAIGMYLVLAAVIDCKAHR